MRVAGAVGQHHVDEVVVVGCGILFHRRSNGLNARPSGAREACLYIKEALFCKGRPSWEPDPSPRR